MVQAGCDSPPCLFPSAGIMGVRHHAQLGEGFLREEIGAYLCVAGQLYNGKEGGRCRRCWQHKEALKMPPCSVKHDGKCQLGNQEGGLTDCVSDCLGV